ncbi:DUF554 family protein, partial [uncultured Bilophila sp.]|uniref:DUF554 family protein n=1 Tax=uncultured Bilophila sp. TaxID=529385 RepID=UPI00280B125E
MLVIGFKMALLMQNPLIVIFSIVIGSGAGEVAGLEARLVRVGDWLKARLKSSNPLFTDGMVNASVLFCIGAMAITGEKTKELVDQLISKGELTVDQGKQIN